MTTFCSLRFWQISVAVFACFAVHLATAQTPAKLDPPVTPTVSGKFTGNGKNAAIRFVTVEEHEPFSGKEAITLIFSEKDPATTKKPSFDAMFGKLGSALILNVFYDGGIFGCQVVHSAHKKQGFSSVGNINMSEFKLAGGNVSGHVSTGKELDAFGEKWEVDLTFAAPLPDKLRSASAAPPNPVASESTEPAKNEHMPKPAAGPLMPVRKLPLPKDATNVEFKKTVEQIRFSSARPVAEVTKEFSANLQQQGWKDGAGSLVGTKNSILKRELGNGKLTIMIQSAAAGSVVKIFTEGLDWSGEGASAPSAATKASDADDAEAQAQKALKDAMKGLPSGM